MDKKRLNQILDELISIVGERKMDVPINVVFSEACSFERGILAGESKFKTQSSQNSASSGKKEDSKPNESVTKEAEIILATPRQLNYIYQNGLDVNTQGLTKDEASKKIGEHKARKSQ
jgi:hypothetical protein